MSNLESLYRRVELLESVVGQNQDQKDPVPLYNKLSKIEDTLNTKLIAAGKTLEHKIQKIQNFLKKYESESTNLILSAKSKLNLVLDNEQEIVQAIKQFQEIQTLQKYLSFQPIQELGTKIEQLEKYKTMSKIEVEDQNIKVVEKDDQNLPVKFLNQQEQFEQIIKLQKEIFTALNQKFIFLENAVSILEQQ